MSGKNKVTLYIPSDLHRKLKIKAAVESEPMSAIAERAIIFYLSNPHVVDEVEAAQGNAHRVYSCPECETDVLVQGGELVQLNEQPGVIQDDDLDLPSDIDKAVIEAGNDRHGREHLVPC
jgi:hypothetical protein